MPWRPPGLLRTPLLAIITLLLAALTFLPASANPPHVLWQKGAASPSFVHLSPNEQLAAVVTYEYFNPTVVVHRLSDFRPVQTFAFGNLFEWRGQVAWSHDSGSLFACYGRTIVRFNLATGAFTDVGVAPSEFGFLDGIAQSPDGQRLVVWDGREFAFLNLATGAFSAVFTADHEVTEFKWLPGSASVVADGPNVYNLAGSQILANSVSIARGFDVTPNGSHVLQMFNDGLGVRLVRLSDNVTIYTASSSANYRRPRLFANGDLVLVDDGTVDALHIHRTSDFRRVLSVSPRYEWDSRVTTQFEALPTQRSFYLLYDHSRTSNHPAVKEMEILTVSSDNSSLSRDSAIRFHADRGHQITPTQFVVGSTVFNEARFGASMNGHLLGIPDTWSSFEFRHRQLDGELMGYASLNEFADISAPSPDASLWGLVQHNNRSIRVYRGADLAGQAAYTGHLPEYLQVTNGGSVLVWERAATRVYALGSGSSLLLRRTVSGTGDKISPHLSPSGERLVVAEAASDNRAAVVNVGTGGTISRFTAAQTATFSVLKLISDTRLFTVGRESSQIRAQVWDVSGAVPALLQTAQVALEPTNANSFEVSGAIAPNGEFAVIGQRWELAGDPNRWKNRIQVVRFDGNVVLRTQNDLLVGSRLGEIVVSLDSRVAYIRNGATMLYALNVFIPNRVMSLSLNPTSLKGGRTSTGTVGIEFPAPTGGVRVDLASSNTAAATVPASVTVPAGATTATFTVATSAVRSDTAVNITASRPEAGSQTASLQVQRPLPIALTLNPTSIRGGQSSTATVTLDGAAPSGGLVLSLRSNRTEATVPATATVPAGATSVTFTINTVKVGAITYPTIYATANSVTRFALLTVRPPIITGLTFNPATVFHGGTSTGTVTIDEAAPSGGVRVTLRSTRPSVANGPAFVDIPEGATQATFTATTSTVGVISSATFVATVGTVTVGRGLTVLPPLLTGMTISPGSVTGGQNATVTVTIEAPAPAGGVRVDLRSSQAAAIVPASMTIPQGQTSATFTVRTTTVASRVTAQVYATIAGRARFVQLVINP